jgi:ATP-dependent DNA ligase
MMLAPVFRDLLFRRRQCVFIAFDLIDLNGNNLRTLLLIERKAMFTLVKANGTVTCQTDTTAAER